MATIKDIAKYAGVSHGTVSNVLNHKGNVSTEKILLVEQAAKALGYQMNSQASGLRSGKSKTICIIVPGIDMKMYGKLYAGIEKALHDMNYTIEILCSEGMPDKESRLLKKALSMQPTAIVLASSAYKNEEAVPEDTMVVMVDRYVKGFPDNAVFISFDYERAGREIAEKCIRDGNKSVALMCENRRYTSNRSFIKGAADVLESEGAYLEVLEVPAPLKFNRAFDVLYASDPFEAVITMSREDVENIKMAHTFNLRAELPELYSVVSRDFGFENGNMYEMDYKLMGKHIAELILKKDAGAPDGETCGPGAIQREIIEEGRFPQHRVYQRKGEETLKLLTVKNSTSEAVRRLLPLFQEQSGIRVNVVEAPYDELRKMVCKMKDESAFDLVRIDMAWMLGEGGQIFREMDCGNDIIQRIRTSVFDGIPEEYYSVNGTMYTLPLDACVQMLFCRKDLFEDELIKREYYETRRKKLLVPRTYKEYNEIAEFFTRRYNRRSPVSYGTALTYGRSYTAACDLLPRFYEKGGHMPDGSGKVAVDTQEMRDALTDYLQSIEYATKEPHFWWRESAKEFAEGNVAMNILFSSYAADMVHNISSKVAGKIIYAEVPGGRPLLGGGSIGITKSTDKEETCLQFLEWLYSDEIAEMVTYLGGFICNRNIVNNAEILELYPWIQDIEQMFRKGKRGRKEKNERYDEFALEDILGSAVISASSGVSTPEEALEDAQKICNRMFNQ